MSERLSEILQKDITTIRNAFILYCKLLELSKDTCLSLILMLNSKLQLVLIMAYMAKILEKQVPIPQGTDVTTMVVLKAQEVKGKLDRVGK